MLKLQVCTWLTSQVLRHLLKHHSVRKVFPDNLSRSVSAPQYDLLIFFPCFLIFLSINHYLTSSIYLLIYWYFPPSLSYKIKPVNAFRLKSCPSYVGHLIKWTISILLMLSYFHQNILMAIIFHYSPHQHKGKMVQRLLCPFFK